MIKSYKNTMKEKKENSILGCVYKSGDGREPDTKIAALWRVGGWGSHILNKIILSHKVNIISVQSSVSLMCKI